jgi:hypothetical protein
MKNSRKVRSLWMVAAIIAGGLLLAIVVIVPAYSGTTLLSILSPTRTPTMPAGDLIPLTPISDLTSLNATIKIDVNGLINSERTQGNLNADLTITDNGKSRITVTGSLLGDIAAQVGGSLMGLFKPSSVDIYKVPQGTYIVVNSLFPVCIKPADSKATAALDEMNPQSLMSMLTSNEVARGKLVEEKLVNGVPVKHYVIDGDAFLSAAQQSKDPKLNAFGKALWAAKDADLYVDGKSGYPLAFVGGFSGSYDPLQFKGDFDVQIELTGINTNTPVNLPASCNKPITP